MRSRQEGRAELTAPVLTFFNIRGGVGKKSLVYHLAWKLSEIGQSVLVCDLDPQANLTAGFLEEDRLDQLWNKSANSDRAATIFQCVKPLTEAGDLSSPRLLEVAEGLSLLPGDLALCRFERVLSEHWPKALGSEMLYRPFRILTAFWSVMHAGADECGADVILVDAGPNVGAINRSILVSTDKVVVPLGADLFSLQGLRHLGPTLSRWRSDWTKRLDNWSTPGFSLPKGKMETLGYIVQQHGFRLTRPVKAYDKWVNRMPEEYARSLLDRKSGPFPEKPAEDEYCLATVKHYRSLVPMAQEHRKPIFHLTAADGAIGGHMSAVTDAARDFRRLAKRIARKAGLQSTNG